ncbi:hypothetical protein HMPREF0758_4980 [Serratia odorifera DSM 4582]|uniref:Uncharacterized protein n=1 Tax=Serratia odorifera DSM 4582 TaxID=667129 RepID=D4E9Y0_SEROD|nr:hypothetical protein HMPREF0758_4980 [Serratia odorifera DSM 4582]
MDRLVILNFCFATGLPVLLNNAWSDPATQQKFDLFNNAVCGFYQNKNPYDNYKL